MRTARYNAVGNSRPEDTEAKQREGREHQCHRIFDSRLVTAGPRGELGEQGRSDPNDDGKHQYLDAGRDDVSEYALGCEGGLPKQAERNQHETGQGRQLELDQGDKELDGEDEERQQHDDPGKQQHHDLYKILEEADVAHQPRNRFKDRPSGIQADLGDPSWPQEICGRQARARGPQPQTGKALEDDAGQAIPVPDEESEDADKQGLLDQPSDHVLIGAPDPEQSRQRDVDGNKRGREMSDLISHQAEARVDIAGECFQKLVDDACTTHLSLRRLRCRKQTGRQTALILDGRRRCGVWIGPGGIARSVDVLP